MILRRYTVTQTLTEQRLANLTPAQVHGLDRFTMFLVLKKIELTRRDILSRNPRRRTDGLSFLYSDFAELLCSGVGLSIECVRKRVDTPRFFIELPDLQHGGMRFRSSNRPVVIGGLIRPIEDSQFYRIVIQEPETFAENYRSVTSADWVEVNGPARWLTEAEYLRLLEKSCTDKKIIAIARAMTRYAE